MLKMYEIDDRPNEMKKMLYFFYLVLETLKIRNNRQYADYLLLFSF